MDLSSVEPNECSIKKEDQKANVRDLLSSIKEKRSKAIKRYNDVIYNKYNIWDDFLSSEEHFKIIMKKYSEAFFAETKCGFDDYINGDWESAKFHFEKAKESLNSESKNEPSFENLLKFMGQNNFKAPETWEGYRTEGPGL